MLFSELIAALREGNAGLQDHQVANDPNIQEGASLEIADWNQISFVEHGSNFAKELEKSKAGAVLLPINEDLRNQAIQKGIAWATLKDPRLAFAQTLGLLNPIFKPQKGIHPTAVIEEGVKIETGVFIGPHVSIGSGCHIKEGAIIHPGVVIYPNVVIGYQSELHANCVIHPNSKIGKKCVVHSNAVIGSEGFGFVPTKDGWYKMPQTGLVILEDNVEVGCSSTIDRPAVGETRIGEGTKIDNLVQIGHGVKTGKGCAMAAQVGIAGGARLGNGVILAGQVGVGNRVNVGDNVIASSKCGIHADIKSGEIISGFPAMPNRQWLRCSANFKKLPEISKSIKDLNRETFR